jgi:hypothetical protein
VIEPLIIHPDRLEDVGQKLANALMDCGIISMEESTYDKAISVIMRSLQHQSWVNRTWRGDEDDATRLFRSDLPEPLPQDGSSAI